MFSGLLAWGGDLAATLAASIAVLLSIGVTINELATGELRSKLSVILTSKQTQTISGYLHFCTTIFDRVFTKRHLTLNCFLRSAAVSVSGFVLSSIYVMLTSPSAVVINAVKPFLALSFDAIFALIFVLFWSLLTDYVSLLQTRWVLRLAERQTAAVALLMVVADLILSFLVFVVIFPLCVLVWNFIGITLVTIKSGMGLENYTALFNQLTGFPLEKETAPVIRILMDSLLNYLVHFEAVLVMCISEIQKEFFHYYIQYTLPLISPHYDVLPNGAAISKEIKVPVPLSQLYFTTYLTNIWTLILACALLVYRLDVAFGMIKSRSSKWLNLKKNPVHGAFFLLTLVTSMVIVIFYVASGLLSLFL